jgi:uncharacterized protein
MNDAPPPAPGSVTIVTQTRAAADKEDAFARWQTRVGSIVANQPGFIKQTILPPNPPGQVDWVILQRFASTEAALAWLRSDERQHLLAEVQPLLIGQDDVHLVNDTESGVLPSPASAVVSTRVKPGQEDNYRRWERKIAAAQAKSPGFQGYRFQPPVPGVQKDWLAIVRFDSEANLQKWLDSPERKALLEEADAFTDEFHARIVRTGFDQWFDVGAPGASPPSAWKQNMIVLATLYPVVFLVTAWLEHPFLVGVLGMKHWSALFIDNVVGILILSIVTPWLSRSLSWWLRARDSKGDVAGAAILVGFYALLLLASWQYESHIWAPW